MPEVPPSTRRSRRSKASQSKPIRATNYRQVTNSLALTEPLSADAVHDIHQTALKVLQDLGIKVLLPEARQIFAKAGAKVDEENQMVWLGKDLVTEAVSKAPSRFTMRGKQGTGRDLDMGGRSLVFGPGAGCPNAHDMDRGRRPGSLNDFVEITKLIQSFDIMHVNVPMVEPQDCELNVRHLDTMKAQLELSDKVPFVFARGTGHVEDSFEITRLARGLSQEEFESDVWITTVINSNSPRQLDKPMSQGIIDFARYNQVSIITPFCLSGAMAPITIAGALTLSHAEALAGIALAQVTRPGAPVVYGAFSSNVHMKSGAPVFGTPEHIKTTFAAGQLARLLNLPWRSGGGTAANIADVQADYETQMSVWGSVLGGANLVYHSAGWLEGGLSFGYEKFINDIELLQTIAELANPIPTQQDDIGFDAIASVEPGGHFFATEHTMQRYATQFYEPVVSDWSNFGAWTEAGAVDTSQRAYNIWKQTIADFKSPVARDDHISAAFDHIEKIRQAGGTKAVSG